MLFSFVKFWQKLIFSLYTLMYLEIILLSRLFYYPTIYRSSSSQTLCCLLYHTVHSRSTIKQNYNISKMSKLSLITVNCPYIQGKFSVIIKSALLPKKSIISILQTIFHTKPQMCCVLCKNMMYQD